MHNDRRLSSEAIRDETCISESPLSGADGLGLMGFLETSCKVSATVQEMARSELDQWQQGW